MGPLSFTLYNTTTLTLHDRHTAEPKTFKATRHCLSQPAAVPDNYSSVESSLSLYINIFRM